jgi:hypothetical protein
MAKKEDKEEQESSDEKNLNRVSLIRCPTFEKKYVTRTIPFFTEFDVRITLSNEMINTDDGWATVADEMVILTPVAAKELMQQMVDIVAAFEEIHGPIKARPDKKLITSYTRGE